MSPLRSGSTALGWPVEMGENARRLPPGPADTVRRGSGDALAVFACTSETKSAAPDAGVAASADLERNDAYETLLVLAVTGWPRLFVVGWGRGVRRPLEAGICLADAGRGGADRAAAAA